jgi:anaerobic selenocysteine-containing dehydrogenase
VCRRHVGVLNSSGLDLPRARAKPYNPAYVHPDDLAAVGLAPGDLARVASPHGAVLAVVEADPTLRRGVVSMTHAYGDVAHGDTAVRQAGTNTSRLTVVDRDFDRITGMPRMSNLPVSLGPAGAQPWVSSPDLANAGTTSSTKS